MEKILLSSVQKKRSHNFRERSDVILKTVFRSFRKFFYYKFDATMDFRKVKRRVSYSNNYIELIQEFVALEFSPAVVERLGLQNITDYLAALIHPKEMKEISQFLGDEKAPTADQVADDATLARAQAKVPKQIPLERLQRIDNLASQTQGVLYEFNKQKMQLFFEHGSNIVLLQFFLKICTQFFRLLKHQNLKKSPEGGKSSKGAAAAPDGKSLRLPKVKGSFKSAQGSQLSKPQFSVYRKFIRRLLRHSKSKLAGDASAAFCFSTI